jgi:hypothetical protein
MEKESHSLVEQKESLTPRPGLLDVVIIDGKLAKVAPDLDSVIFLEEEAKTGKKIPHQINWDEYEYKKIRDIATVGNLREKGMITEEEYYKVHWGSEEEHNPYIRDYVTFFGEFKRKK